MERSSEATPQVITVAAAPGGSGPHALAPNLAVRAARRGRQADRRICLVDTTDGSQLSQYAGVSVPDLGEQGSSVDLDEVLVHHTAWNLHLARITLDGASAVAPPLADSVRRVVSAARERFDVVFVATTIRDLYGAPAELLLPEADRLCLELTDNMATVLNVAMWVRSWREGVTAGTGPRVGYVFTPRGDGHLTATEARSELDGIPELGRLPAPNTSRSIDPTVLAAVGTDPVMGAALDRALYEITRDGAFRPRRNEWWRY